MQRVPQAEPADPIASAQARRDRARLAAAQARILALEQQFDALRASPTFRALGPVRRAARFVSRWRGRPAMVPAAPPSRGRLLVIDANWPQPDRDSGSVDIVNLMLSLQRLGFDAVLAADKQHAGAQPARDALTARGVRCLAPDDAASVTDYIARTGGGFDLVILCRVFCGGEYLEQVQRDCGTARIIFNSIDLNFLREERKARLLGDAALLAIAEAIRPREEMLIAQADATLVVSDAEAGLLAQTLPEALVVTMPLARAVVAPVADFGARRGIGFIGGFAHAPNVDAVRYFLAEIWPAIHAALPDCPLTIVGGDAPADLGAGAPGPVSVLGHVPDIGPWFEGLRLTIAPLRFGAGAKGKVASSLAAGVPCVATSVAAEGMGLGAETGVVVADAPADFAAAVVRVHEDAAGWMALSAGGNVYAADMLSIAHWQDRLDRLLKRMGY